MLLCAPGVSKTQSHNSKLRCSCSLAMPIHVTASRPPSPRSSSGAKPSAAGERLWKLIQITLQPNLVWHGHSRQLQILRCGMAPKLSQSHSTSPKLTRRIQCSSAFSPPPTPRQGGFPKRSERSSVESRSQLRKTTLTSQLSYKVI